MSDSINPYRAPREAEGTSAASEGAQRIDIWAIVAWPVVFGLYALFPAWMAFNASYPHGLAGTVLAMGVLLACGWFVCWQRPGWMRLLMLGSIPIGLTQFAPILHIAAGLVAFELAQAGGLVHRASGGPYKLESDLAGFVVVLLMLGMLWSLAAVLGGLLWLLPVKWFHRRGTSRPCIPAPPVPR